MYDDEGGISIGGLTYEDDVDGGGGPPNSIRDVLARVEEDGVDNFPQPPLRRGPNLPPGARRPPYHGPPFHPLRRPNLRPPGGPPPPYGPGPGPGFRGMPPPPPPHMRRRLHHQGRHFPGLGAPPPAGPRPLGTPPLGEADGSAPHFYNVGEPDVLYAPDVGYVLLKGGILQARISKRLSGNF